MTRSAELPAVSIVICTYNRAELLRRTLLFLERVFGIEEAEVIVVDNRSSDHTAEVVRVCTQLLKKKVHMTYVYEPRQGLSVARNTGIAHTRAPIIAFLDDDAVPVMNWLGAIRQGFASYPRAAALGGIVHADFETARPTWLIKELEFPYTIVNLGEQPRRYPRKLVPFGANMAVRREAMGQLRFPEELGRKGASLLSGEEVWFFSKLQRQGWQLMYMPGMAVRHHIAAERLEQEWIRKRYYYQGVSMAMEGTSLLARIRIVTNLFLRSLYLRFQARTARSPGEQLLGECRRLTIQGAMDTLRGEGAEASYE